MFPMHSEDNTSSGFALPPAFVQIPPADWALIRVLLARFPRPPTQPWVWFNSPITPDGPRTTYFAAYHPATEHQEGAAVRDASPPDCPSYPWTGWGLLYPDQAAAPF